VNRRYSEIEISIWKVMSRTEFQNLTILASTKKLFQMGKGWKNELQRMFLQADKLPLFTLVYYCKSKLHTIRKHFECLARHDCLLIKSNSCWAGNSSQGKQRQILQLSLPYYVTLCIVVDTTSSVRQMVPIKYWYSTYLYTQLHSITQ
jgi:hypothetical protein